MWRKGEVEKKERERAREIETRCSDFFHFRQSSGPLVVLDTLVAEPTGITLSVMQLIWRCKRAEGLGWNYVRTNEQCVTPATNNMYALCTPTEYYVLLLRTTYVRTTTTCTTILYHMYTTVCATCTRVLLLRKMDF